MINTYKDIGQNFIKNKNIIMKIVKFINPKKKNFLLEIGCGNGELTKEILKYTKNIITTEIDDYLIKKTKKKIKNIKILKINFLKINFSKLKKKNIRIFGNIPYYITHKIIYKLINNYNFIKDINILVQKEFANNLLIKKKNISKTTIIVNLIFKIKKIIEINNKNFIPKPKIKSILIKLTKKKNNNYIKNIKYIIHILNNIFFKKKKKIYNNLKKFININEFKKIKINPNKRINQLNLEEYKKIFNFIINKKQNNKN